MDNFENLLENRDALASGLPERLVEERLRLNLRQTDVIKTLEIGPMTLSRYESTGKERRKPSFDVLTGLALMGYDLMYLVTGERNSSVSADALSKEESELLTLYRRSKSPEHFYKMVKAYAAAE